MPQCDTADRFEEFLDFPIRSNPYQPKKKELDTDIPPGELPFDNTKRWHTGNPDRGRHDDIKVPLSNARAKKDE